MNVVITLLDADGEEVERVPVDCCAAGTEPDGVEMWEVIWPPDRDRLVHGAFTVSLDELPTGTSISIPTSFPLT